MDLRQLEHFVAIVEAGGQTKAAQSAGVTQQALSKSLARLEAEMGARLIERTPKGVAPTRVGVRLMDSARAILAEAGHLRRDIDELTGRGPASLVVGLSPIAAAGEIGRRIGRFQAAHAGVRLDVQSGLEMQFTRSLLAGELDLAVAASVEPPDPLVSAQVIGQERWVIAGCAGHTLLEPAVRLTDLEGAKWLWGPKAGVLETTIEQAFKACGMASPVSETTTTSLVYAMNIIARETLLCILPRSIVAEWPGVIYRDLGDEGWSTDLILMKRRRAAPSRLELTLIEQIAG
ncbi:MAG: LysR family transcriptional regulator [Pseudomonadota bacterium]|uniref:LysR family transcriptional regulator n=1 Tax=unclassified Phenylobacterium TaxID=2640670 RepID=UPI0006FA7E56|nr:MULTISPECIES: LysR family transcriptional regulator [unclassified Phenylobacterium]KRB40183.1 hypothetical protein ASE02_10435 [Phenylobacterium sp. Root700]MBT9469847.1 LysR family transcriptional regulator [Phenylobacterium sp.]